MGKNLPFNRQHGVEHRQHGPWWFWGMIHALDYHHWHYLKKLQKLLNHRKHHPRRRRRSPIASPNTRSFTLEAGKELEQVDSEAEHLLGQHRNEEGEALAVEDISKEETGKDRVLNFHVGKLKQNNPIDSEARSTEVEDEVFERILHNRHGHVATVKDFTGDHEGIGKPRFTKARSFPFSDSSRVRHYGPSTLQHKQSEVWLSHGVDRQNIVPHSAPRKQENAVSSDVSSQTLENHGWNHLIISQFKGIKRRIRLALNESGKGSLPAETMSDQGNCSDEVKEISSDQPGGSKAQKMTRISSLNESLDKYTRLFEESLRSELRASKLNNSRSLNLTDDGKSNSTTRTFRRRLSLPDYETLSPFLGDLSYDSLHSKEMKMKGVLLNDSPRTDYTEGEIYAENSMELRREEHVVLHGNKIDISSNTITEAEPSNPLSVIGSFLLQDKSNSSELEEMDLRPCTTFNEENAHTMDEAGNIPIKPGYQMAIEDDDCNFNFNLVKSILNLGGFFESEVLEPWDSMHLPLDPKVLDHQLHSASEFHGRDCSDANCIHPLLFDLTNEALLDICEGSFTYFPKAFSFYKFITRPITSPQHLLEEVWTRVKRYRGNMGRCMDLKLDDIIGRDMVKGDRWIDHEWESECVALELEDMILEELVNEMVYS
ncbi:hypothetical protein SAY86_008371 [Trapa natans]|uniref:DUF4378 domain-containing protein n=1 Tax=Trapa natans TaxID=22666 RepID=A0AAN7QAU6_TRANT|nr:hypothetical protein SAY86_008371 [Trapa natans]